MFMRIHAHSRLHPSWMQVQGKGTQRAGSSPHPLLQGGARRWQCVVVEQQHGSCTAALSIS